VLRVKTDRTASDQFADVMPEDLLKFGMIPEFVGACPFITSVHNPGPRGADQILTEPKNAAVRQYRSCFELDAWTWSHRRRARGGRRSGILRGTGARGAARDTRGSPVVGDV